MAGHEMAEGEAAAAAGVKGKAAAAAAAARAMGTKGGSGAWWIKLFGVVSWACTAVVFFSVILVLTPKRLIAGVPLLGNLQAYMLSKLRYAWLLSMEGPFVKWFVRFAKLLGGKSRFSSQPQVPKSVRAKVLSTTEVELHWTPQLPVNPFHEEHYICGWCAPEVDPEKSVQEVELLQGDYSKVEGKEGTIGKAARLKWTLGGLPPRTLLRFRFCAVNAAGERSPWTTELAARTFVEPSKDNGFEGPLLPGSPIEKYTWWQSKHEVGLTIPVPDEWKGKEMNIKVTPSRLDMRRNDVELLRGEFPFKVKHDETDWEIEPAKGDHGRQITMTLRKEKLMQKWASLLDGSEHHRIDTEKLKLYTEGNAMNEFGTLDLWE